MHNKEKITHKHLPPMVYGLKGWVQQINEDVLVKLFNETLEKSGFKVLDFSSHQFPVAGFTAFWLLAESHLAIHTFADSGWCYVELSSCNQRKSALFKLELDKENLEIQWDSHIPEPCGMASPVKCH